MSGANCRGAISGWTGMRASIMYEPTGRERLSTSVERPWALRVQLMAVAAIAGLVSRGLSSARSLKSWICSTYRLEVRGNYCGVRKVRPTRRSQPKSPASSNMTCPSPPIDSSTRVPRPPPELKSNIFLKRT